MKQFEEVMTILELHNEGLSVSAIAGRVGMDRKTVRKYIARGVAVPTYSPRKAVQRPIDRHIDYLRHRLGQWPELTAQRLHRELGERGFAGSYSCVRDAVRRLRQSVPVVFPPRFETPPGHQAQMDFSEYVVNFASEGPRRVHLFGMVLAHSRLLWGRFALRQGMQTMFSCHRAAFEAIGGVPREILYDRMRAAVTGEDGQGMVVYNARFTQFASHYGFRPKACRAYRPQTKGKIERPFRFIKGDFLLGSEFRDIDDLNAQFARWLADIANARVHRTTGRVPMEAFAEERSSLLPLPLMAFDSVIKLERKVSRDGMVSLDGNQYSVPDGTAAKVLEVQTLADEIRILDRGRLVAKHPVLIGSNKRSLLTEHRTTLIRKTKRPTPAMQGDSVMQRPLDVYGAIGERLAAGGGA